MFVKLLYICVVVSVVFGAYVKDSKSDEASPTPFYELPCMSSGGICQLKGECPEGKQAHSGLCPLQQDEGVECCYSVAKSATTCLSHGGECMPSSSHCALTYAKASDCESDETCCILVH